MAKKTPYGNQQGIHVEWVAVRKGTIYILIASVIGLIGAGGGLFWWFKTGAFARNVDKAPVEAPTTTDDNARFVTLDGTVKVRKAGSYEWIDAGEATALSRGDTVRTVGKSSAQLRLFDGTEYLIKPDTIFMIEVMHEDPQTRASKIRVELTAGQVNLQTPTVNVAGSSSELATPTTEASFSESTVADVGFDEGNQVSEFAVFSGRSRLRSGDKEVTLESSQAVEVRGTGIFSEVIKLPGVPALVTPAHLSRVSYRDPGRETTELNWRPVQGARLYHVMLDQNPNFPAPQEYKVNDVRVLVPGLKPGAYFWTVRAIDSRNREGGFANFAKFTITHQTAKAEPPQLRLSSPSVSIDGLVTINGVTEPDAVVTINDERVSVKSDGSFRHYLTFTRSGRHPIVVKAHKRSGGTAEETLYADIGSD